MRMRSDGISCWKKSIDELNSLLALPEDVNIVIEECQEKNSFYDPEMNSVKICFDLFEHVEETFLAETSDKKLVKQRTYDAMRFVFLHELGHALIDVYDLPVSR